MNALDEFLESVTLAGWVIEMREPTPVDLSGIVHSRFPQLPDDFRDFLVRVQKCVNPTNNAWFLCEENYLGSGEDVWRWNEWEIMSLSAASDDAEWQSEIRSFWATHMPIAMSVMGDYGYLAIAYGGERPGRIVQGFAPEFESPLNVANSYSELMELMAKAVLNPADYPELGSFL